MFVHTFPGCCGAGILVFEHLTAHGEEADFEEIKKWIYFARKNGYRMYDFPHDYGSNIRGVTKVDKLDGENHQEKLVNRNGWGMLLVITAPHQKEIEARLKKFGTYMGDENFAFKPLMTTVTPYYQSASHTINLWGLDIFQIPEAKLKPKLTEAAKK